ncbi:MAG TPA: hypothetical protein VFV38_21950 [Ktedonobacteraceae bacterium]|nr:hypothetical protein [Ktedonobacteraceae bacterium]
MPEQSTFKEALQSYFGRKMVTDTRTGKRFEATQIRLAEALVLREETLSRKLKDPARFTNDEVRRIGETLIWWGLLTERNQLQQLFRHVGYLLPNEDWHQEPWRRLLGTAPPSLLILLPLQNAGFEAWDNERPVAWHCDTKVGWIRQVPGKDGEGSSALEIGGKADNQYWVYCRTRETQDISVVPGSKIQLSFWARLLEEGKASGRERNVEVAYFVDDAWKWEFALELTDRLMDETWRHYAMEWWDVPPLVTKIAVGVVVCYDGAFQVDDIQVRMRHTP